MGQLHLRNKTCSPRLHNLVKTEAKVWENSRADQRKPETQSKIKLLFSVLTKRKTINEARMHVYFNFFHETVNSHNLETEATILLTSFSCFIAL